MSEQEATDLLLSSYDLNTIYWIYDNSNEIKDKIEFYSLEKHQSIPEVEVTHYDKYDWSRVPEDMMDTFRDDYKVLTSLIESDNEQEKYWIQECIIAMQEKVLSTRKSIGKDLKKKQE